MTMTDTTDPFSAHEALDRAASMGDIFDMLIVQHPFVRGDPELLRQAEAVAVAIGDFYQAGGERQPG